MKNNRYRSEYQVAAPSELAPLKAFVSLFFIISALFIIVFAKMEERRVGYSILKLTRELRLEIEEKREREFKFAKLTRPEHVEKVAQNKFTLKKIKNNQIIHLSGSFAGQAPIEIEKLSQFGHARVGRTQ